VESSESRSELGIGLQKPENLLLLRLETALWHDAHIGVIRGIRPVDAGLSRERS